MDKYKGGKHTKVTDKLLHRSVNKLFLLDETVVLETFIFVLAPFIYAYYKIKNPLYLWNYKIEEHHI